MKEARGTGELHRDVEVLEQAITYIRARIHHMDAQVVALQNEVVLIKGDVAAVGAALAAALAKITVGIDTDDEAAITAAVVDLTAIHTALQLLAAPMDPPVPPATKSPSAP